MYESQTSALRRLVAGRNGELTVLVYDPDQTWEWHQQNIVSVIPHLLPDVAYAYVTIAPSNMTGWYEAEKRPKPPFGPGANNLAVARLLHRYVYDVCGRQLLTSEHLASLGDLNPDRWNIEPLGEGYFLVSHRDVRSWFDVDLKPYADGDSIYQRPSTPPRATLDQARIDFAPAMLTLERVYSPSPPSEEP